MLLDIWVGRKPTVGSVEEPTSEATLVRLFALVLGIVLTWLLYVLLARFVLWRLGTKDADGDLAG